MTNPRSLTRIVAVAAALGALALAGCGSDSSSTTATSGPMVGGSTTNASGIVTGVAKCDEASIAKAVADTAKAQNTTATLPKGSYECADGWAVAFPDVGPKGQDVTVTYVYEAEGQFWVPQDRAKVCVKDSPVPKSLYAKACESN